MRRDENSQRRLPCQIGSPSALWSFMIGPLSVCCNPPCPVRRIPTPLRRKALIPQR